MGGLKLLVVILRGVYGVPGEIFRSRWTDGEAKEGMTLKKARFV